MHIQYISKKIKNYNYFKCATFETFELVDKFDLTIIDYSSKDIWDGEFHYLFELPIEEKIVKLNEMIQKSPKRNVMYILPQDIEWTRLNVHGLSEKLSDVRKHFLETLSRICFFRPDMSIAAVSDETKLGDQSTAKSDFFFDVYPDTSRLLTKSLYSNHATTVHLTLSGLIYTFLDLSSEEKLISFLNTVGIGIRIFDFPQWLTNYQWFNDKEQLFRIGVEEKKIEDSKTILKECQKILKENMYYKQLLTSQGDELVEIVLKVLQEMLSIDTQSFKDKKIHDFELSFDDDVYLFEIKGIGTNVKNANISQLDVHESRYLDELDDQGAAHPKNIRKILIINHQRDKELEKRESVQQDQVNLAKKKEVLIIETVVLLKLLEKFRLGQLTKEEFVVFLTCKTGLLKV